MSSKEYDILKSLERTKLINYAIKFFLFKKNNGLVFEKKIKLHRFFRRNFFYRIYLIYKRFIQGKRQSLITYPFNTRVKSVKNAFRKAANFEISKDLKSIPFFSSIKRLKYKNYFTDTGFGVFYPRSVFKRFRHRFFNYSDYTLNKFFNKFLVDRSLQRKKFFLGLYLTFFLRNKKILNAFFKKETEFTVDGVLVEDPYKEVRDAFKIYYRFLAIQKDSLLSQKERLKRPRIQKNAFSILNEQADVAYSGSFIKKNFTFLARFFFSEKNFSIALNLIKIRLNNIFIFK